MRDYLIETAFELSQETACIIAGGLQDLLSLNVSAIGIDSHTWAIRVHGTMTEIQESESLGYIAGVRLMLTELA